MHSRVAILMGSRSDLEAMSEAFRILKEFDVEFEAYAMSAHRTADAVSEYVKDLEKCREAYRWRPLPWVEPVPITRASLLFIS